MGSSLATADDFVPGYKFETNLEISSEDMRAFAALSGDRNPLHTDAAFARQRGFKGPVVYGALIVARLSEAIGMHLPGRNGIWAGLKIDFMKPLYVDEAAVLNVVIQDFFVATGMLELTFTLEQAGRVLARGSAETVVRADD